MANVDRSVFDTPITIGAALLVGLLAGIFFQSSRTKWFIEEPLTASEMRSTLRARCMAAPDVVAEIDEKLADNIDGLITPTIVRKVLKDVVSKC